MSKMPEDFIMMNPQDLLAAFKMNQANEEANAAQTKEYLKDLPAEKMVNELKHLIYRHIKVLAIANQSYNKLTVTEKMLLEAVEDLFDGVLNSLKWIALHDDLSYTEEFGDTILVQRVGDIIFGKPISEEHIEEELRQPKEYDDEENEEDILNFLKEE